MESLLWLTGALVQPSGILSKERGAPQGPVCPASAPSLQTVVFKYPGLFFVVFGEVWSESLIIFTDNHHWDLEVPFLF